MKKYSLLTSILGSLLLLTTSLGFAQTSTGTVRGTVTDPSGAAIPSADLVISNADGFSRKLKSGATGTYEVNRLVPGRYSLSVAAKGFTQTTIGDLMVYGDKTISKDVQLEIFVNQQVDVEGEGLGVSTSPDDNANSMVIKGQDLDALSDDPDDLQNELTALAGPSAGPSGGEIYIDGFSGGQLPPKSAIREIRINRNPFSAQYDKLGYGRIEILTKPGTDKFHGSLMINGNDNAFNSLNPFVTSEPSYYSTFLTGNASGSLNKSSSWFASVFRRDNQTNSIINAELPTGNYTAAVSNPQTRLDVSPRFDFQLGEKNTLSVRYMFDRQTQTNSGVSGLSLQTQAYNVLNYENTLQISDTQVLSSKVVNDTRFQYTADRNNQVAVNTAPTLTVEGSFTGGGNNSGTIRDNQDRFEFQDYVTAAEGKHAINFGTRIRLNHEVNSSTSGYNGSYTYQSLAAYSANQPSQYSITSGSPLAKIDLFDAALFYQDDWTAKPNLTLSYGLRYEGQNRISNHADWAPRLSLSYAPAAHDGKKASTVFRAGYGWFFDRFSSTYVLDAIHQNGINQQQTVTNEPGSTSSIPSPTIYTVAPNMKASVNMQAAVGVDHSFGKFATVSATYLNSRGVHQYLSDNINAYIASTYNATTGTGVRPNGINENIYQFQSGGVYNQNQLMVNYTIRTKKVSLFGFYTLGFAKSDTSGATYFSSNQTDPGADYGRASFDVRNRFLLGGSYTAPFGISVSPFLVANSGNPFNITLGQDLNGDNQFNDRPALATAATASANLVATALGNFDVNPGANEARIPYDLGTGPAQFSMNLRLSKSFGIGPKVEGGSGFSGGGPGGPGGGGPGGGGPGGGGLGPGGLGGNGGGPPRLDQAVPRRYSLTFAVMGRNVFNDDNKASPIGVLPTSSVAAQSSTNRFDKYTSIAGGFFGSAASNRSIDLQATFSF